MHRAFTDLAQQSSNLCLDAGVGDEEHPANVSAPGHDSGACANPLVQKSQINAALRL
jgi:hypothetical protein